MRIASGIILIIVAIIFFFASLGYLLSGGLITGISQLDPETIEQAAQDGEEVTAEERKNLENLQTEGTVVGSGMLAFGVFLLVSAGILIAGAVFLFQGRKPGFIYVAGLLAILGPAIGYFITGFGIVKLFEVVGGIMAIISARMISTAAQTPTEETPSSAA